MNNNILQLNNVTKSFDGVIALDEISMSFKQKQITGLIGPNGSGKTTLSNLVTGFLIPDSGAIFYKGLKINGLPPYRISSLGIGRLFQDVRIFEKLTALENVLVAAKDHPGENIAKQFLSQRRSCFLEGEFLRRAKSWLEFVGLSDRFKTFAGDLSYGQQKLLALARLMMNESDILLLDEPFAGVHPDMVINLLNLIKTMASDGKTIIVIEHNMDIVMQISDWIYLLDNGKVTASGLPQDIMESHFLSESNSV